MTLHPGLPSRVAMLDHQPGGTTGGNPDHPQGINDPVLQDVPSGDPGLTEPSRLPESMLNPSGVSGNAVQSNIVKIGTDHPEANNVPDCVQITTMVGGETCPGPTSARDHGTTHGQVLPCSPTPVRCGVFHGSVTVPRRLAAIV